MRYEVPERGLLRPREGIVGGWEWGGCSGEGGVDREERFEVLE